MTIIKTPKVSSVVSDISSITTPHSIKGLCSNTQYLKLPCKVQVFHNIIVFQEKILVFLCLFLDLHGVAIE